MRDGMSDQETDKGDNITSVEQLVSVERVSLNVKQSVIVTTEDKIRLSLDSYLRSSQRHTDWVAPLSLLITIIATLVTATFNDLGLSSATWKAIFVIAGIGSAIWLIKALLALRNMTTIEELIDEIKTGNRNNGPRNSGGAD